MRTPERSINYNAKYYYTSFIVVAVAILKLSCCVHLNEITSNMLRDEHGMRVLFANRDSISSFFFSFYYIRSIFIFNIGNHSYLKEEKNSQQDSQI